VAAEAARGVSGTVKDLVVGSDLVFEEQASRVLKGVPGEWRVYAADSPGSQEFPKTRDDAHSLGKPRATRARSRTPARNWSLAGPWAASSQQSRRE